jgi:hypothetical protein
MTKVKIILDDLTEGEAWTLAQMAKRMIWHDFRRLSAGRAERDDQAAARDASIMCSIGLQCGVPVDAFRHAIGRNSDGSAAGPFGKLLDILAKETAK